MAGVQEQRDTADAASDPVARIEREVSVLLRRAELARAARPAVERLLRSGYLLLSELEVCGPLGIAALAASMGVDISTASRQLVPLEEHGLVRRRPNPADARGSLMEITDLGRERLRETRAERHAVYEELMRDWTEEDRAAFAGYLARLNAAMSRRPITSAERS